MIRIFSQYISPKNLLLVFLEGGFIVLGLLCGAWLRFWSNPAEFASYIHAPEFLIQAITFVVTVQLCFYYSDLYDLNVVRTRRDQLISLGQSLGTASLLLGLIYFIFPSLLIGRGVFFIGTALIAAIVVSGRVVMDTAWGLSALRQNILILGTQELALTVARELIRRNDLNIQLVGFLDSSTDFTPDTSLLGRPVLGNLDSVESISEHRKVSRIVVALPDRRGVLPIRSLVRLRVLGVRVEDAHSAVSSLSGRIWLDMVRPSWFVFSEGFHRSRLNMIFKRLIDLVCAVLGLLLASPIMLLVAIAVKLDSKGPALFAQTRVGLRGKCFEVLKFRSMRVDAEAGGAQWAKKNDNRVTRLGRYLRKFRLDELPQFINVIRGDMSFVGPRPERPVFVDQLRELIPYYDERHSVRPGLTGWAQVQFPYGASVEDAYRKLEYDLFYLKNMSICFDAAIILKTIRTVLGGSGAR